jgi:hypothetical protein
MLFLVSPNETSLTVSNTRHGESISEPTKSVPLLTPDVFLSRYSLPGSASAAASTATTRTPCAGAAMGCHAVDSLAAALHGVSTQGAHRPELRR